MIFNQKILGPSSGESTKQPGMLSLLDCSTKMNLSFNIFNLACFNENTYKL